MCVWAAQYIADAINNHKEDRPFVLGLPTGSSPLGFHNRCSPIGYQPCDRRSFLLYRTRNSKSFQKASGKIMDKRIPPWLNVCSIRGVLALQKDSSAKLFIKYLK